MKVAIHSAFLRIVPPLLIGPGPGIEYRILRGRKSYLGSVLRPDGSGQCSLGLEAQDGLRLDLDLSTGRYVAAVWLTVVGEIFSDNGNISALAVELGQAGEEFAIGLEGS